MGWKPQLSVEVDRRSGVASIALRGELDLGTVQILEIALAPIETDGFSAIVLDLRELGFIDSSGLHAVFRAAQRAEASGKRLILMGARPSARRVFELTGTEHLLNDQAAMGVLRRVHGGPRQLPRPPCPWQPIECQCMSARQEARKGNGLPVLHCRSRFPALTSLDGHVRRLLRQEQ